MSKKWPSEDEIRLRLTMYRVRIGDDVFEFPLGTTEAEARAVLDEAKAEYLSLLAQLDHDPGDEDQVQR